MIVFLPINAAAFEDIVAGSLSRPAQHHEIVVVSTGALKDQEKISDIRVISTRLCFVKGRPFHQFPFRNRVRSLFLAIEMIRILGSLSGCDLVVLESSAYFHLRVVAQWARRRGVPVALIGVMAADYSDPRWRSRTRLRSLVSEVAMERKCSFLKIPGLASVFVACRLLDELGRISLWFFSYGQRPWGGCGGLSPYFLPLGPVKPDFCLASAFGADEHFRRVFGDLMEVRSFRDEIEPPLLKALRGAKTRTAPRVLVLVPRVSSIFTTEEHLLGQLRSLGKNIAPGTPVSLRAHPSETQQNVRSLRGALEGGQSLVEMSSGPLWIEARKAAGIIALGRSSAGEYVARNFSTKTDWVDAPAKFDAFLEAYRLRPTLMQQLNDICGSNRRLLGRVR